MAIDGALQMFVLQEFRLRATDADGAVSRIVDASRHGREPALPLLTSIADRRDVALLRGLYAGETAEPDAAQRAALEPFVSSWQPAKHYVARIAERSEGPPTHYRLAVTESGINDESAVAAKPTNPPEDATSTRIGLLWIGAPIGTYAGLLTLLGSYDDPGVMPAAGDWPLPLTRQLGVRIYESR